MNEDQLRQLAEKLDPSVPGITGTAAVLQPLARIQRTLDGRGLTEQQINLVLSEPSVDAAVALAGSLRAENLKKTKK